jgi:transcriptional regulator with XRE-family HTH domain
VVPLATTAKEKIEKLRNWAKTRARPATFAASVQSRSRFCSKVSTKSNAQPDRDLAGIASAVPDGAQYRAEEEKEPMKKTLNPVDVHVGGRIRSRRMQLGFSQEFLADQIGLTFQQVQKYEKGANGVRGSRMQQIANVLTVPPAYFFKDAPGGEGANVDAGADDALRAFVTSRDGLAVVAAWENLKPKLRGLFAQLVETMAEV